MCVRRVREPISVNRFFLLGVGVGVVFVCVVVVVVVAVVVVGAVVGGGGVVVVVGICLVV